MANFIASCTLTATNLTAIFCELSNARRTSRSLRRPFLLTVIKALPISYGRTSGDTMLNPEVFSITQSRSISLRATARNALAFDTISLPQLYKSTLELSTFTIPPQHLFLSGKAQGVNFSIVTFSKKLFE